MDRTPLLILPIVALLGCRNIPPAPEELDELCGYLFAHFDDEDDAELHAGLVNLDTWLLANLEETLEGYSVSDLSEATINALDDRARNTDAMIGAAVGTESVNKPYAVGVPQVIEDQVEVFPESHDVYQRTYLNDADCFVDTKCEMADVSNYIEDTYPIIGPVITNNYGQYRWIELDSGLAYVQRTWFTEPSELEVDWFTLQDQYYLNVALPHGEGALTLQSMWVEAYWDNLPVSEDMAIGLLISQMQNVYVQIDDYVATNGAAEQPRGCVTASSGRAAPLLGLLALLGTALLRRRG